MLALGIDVGSSNIKGALLDLEAGEVRDVVSTPFPDRLTGLPTGWFEVDPYAVVSAVQSILAELAALAPQARDLFFATQMGGCLLVDDRGRPLTNYLSWRDQRTTLESGGHSSLLQRTRERISDSEFNRIGRELKPGSMSVLLAWLSEQGMLPDSATPISVCEYVLATLTGSKPVCEPSNMIGLLDVNGLSWATDVLARWRLDRLDWPALQSYRSVAGEVSACSRSLRCHPGIGDQPAALLGVGLKPGELSLNISTGSQVSRVSDSPRPGDFQTRPYVDGQLLCTVTHLPAGRSLNALVDLMTELGRRQGMRYDSVWPDISAAAFESPDTELAASLTFFTGPLGETGSLTGITVDNLTLGGVFRAAFRNMAENYSLCASSLFPQRDWTRIVVSGGLSQRIPVLRQFLQQKFPGEWREVPETEEVFLGLLELARRTLAT